MHCCYTTHTKFTRCHSVSHQTTNVRYCAATFLSMCITSACFHRTELPLSAMSHAVKSVVSCRDQFLIRNLTLLPKLQQILHLLHLYQISVYQCQCDLASPFRSTQQTSRTWMELVKGHHSATHTMSYCCLSRIADVTLVSTFIKTLFNLHKTHSCAYMTTSK